MPEYDAITPIQWVIALVLCLIAFGIMWWLFWHGVSGERDNAEPVEIVERALSAVLHWRPFHNMSSNSVDDQVESGTEPVHVPVRRTGTDLSAAKMVRDEVGSDSPDTDAEEAGTDEWKTPQISTRLGDQSIVVMLAAQRGSHGKWRFSANKIHELIGGSRAAVLAQVKAIQQGTPPPEFPPLNDEQQSTREQLGLPRH